MRRQKKQPGLRLVGPSAAEEPGDLRSLDLDRDCVLEYPALGGYSTLISLDEHGKVYEELRTPVDRVKDASRLLLERVRNRSRMLPRLAH